MIGYVEIMKDGLFVAPCNLQADLEFITPNCCMNVQPFISNTVVNYLMGANSYLSTLLFGGHQNSEFAKVALLVGCSVGLLLLS